MAPNFQCLNLDKAKSKNSALTSSLPQHIYTEKFKTGIWLKDAILCDLIAFLMCCCFSFSFSKHTLDDVCLSLVFKSVLNSVTFDNCGRFWKCAKQKIMYGSSSSHTKRKHVLQALTTGLILLGFLDCKQKKSFPDTECKVRQQFFTDSDWQV